MTSKERGLGFKIPDIPKDLDKVGKVGVAAGLGIFLLSGIPGGLVLAAFGGGTWIIAERAKKRKKG
jgi:hypothetical protein